MKNLIKITSLLLILVLSLSMAFACSPTDDEQVENEENVVDPAPEKEPERENQILGKEGNIKFDFIVIHADGDKVTYKVETTKDTLAGALLEGSIAKGDEGEFGLYVTEVDGEEAVEDDYWYFYKGDEPLMEGVSSTPIQNGDVFKAVYTK